MTHQISTRLTPRRALMLHSFWRVLQRHHRVRSVEQWAGAGAAAVLPLLLHQLLLLLLDKVVHSGGCGGDRMWLVCMVVMPISPVMRAPGLCRCAVDAAAAPCRVCLLAGCRAAAAAVWV